MVMQHQCRNMICNDELTREIYRAQLYQISSSSPSSASYDQSNARKSWIPAFMWNSTFLFMRILSSIWCHDVRYLCKLVSTSPLATHIFFICRIDMGSQFNLIQTAGLGISPISFNLISILESELVASGIPLVVQSSSVRWGIWSNRNLIRESNVISSSQQVLLPR